MNKNLIFGIYPGSGVSINPGSGVVTGPQDKPGEIIKMLDYLQPAGSTFFVRGYVHYLGNGKTGNMTPAQMEQYVSKNRQLDLVLCYRCNDYNKADWIEFIHSMIDKYSDCLAKIQITEEPNNPDTASGGDGSSSNVIMAMIDGVIAAKEYISVRKLKIQVGSNAVISFDPNDIFWNEVAQLGNFSFYDALDYFGLDFYPGVFRALPPGLKLQQAVAGVLEHFRNVNLKTGKIPDTIPIHITENGWPTSESRNEFQQDEAIREIIHTIIEKSYGLNITCYEFFDLRDADSQKSGFKFGLLRDDYSPKIAFETFKNIILEYSK